ncbi:MAG TPA: hypothetical protein VFH11_05750 [Gemmatimonadota bacterium]|nr:hypothetical protein [Gemmatimonadota bacterium]
MAPSRPLVRRGGAPAIVAVCLVTALAACSSDGGNGPIPPEDSIIPAAIQAQIDALFPTGNLNESATIHVEDVLESADAGQTAVAQSAFVGFVAFSADQAEAGTLLDPNGAAPPTIEDALVNLADDVADEAGLAIPPIPDEAFGESGALAVLDASGGTVVTGDGNGGLQLPAGALPGSTLITIVPIPATGDPEDHDGPLPTGFDQYPRFYQIETFPPISTLAQEGVVGICVVDPPDPFAPTPEVAARLRIAHPDPDDPLTVEILPLADAPFLDCDGASGSLSPAAPGAIGGRISAFSPFAAVDPAGSAPLITSVTPNPIHASTAGGTETPFDVAFADPEGDVAVFRVIEISDPQNALVPGEFPIDDLAIGTSGSFTLTVGCSETPPASCQTGTVIVDFVLIDAAGNESEPFRVTIVFE